MQSDTFAEWQRLTQHYREMSDEELLELDDDFADLTEAAQQVLRNEMSTRGLKRQAVASAPKAPDRPVIPEPDYGALSPTTEDEADENSEPREYTWKTLLCECNEREEAWQIREVLRQAGIESWLDQSRSWASQEMLNPRILVAADQLEQAIQIASQPIPQAIVEQSKVQLPDFEPPVCPECGAADPLLESVEPLNAWRCESCGRQWTDAAEDQAEAAAQQP
jgi:hypothetical protein